MQVKKNLLRFKRNIFVLSVSIFTIFQAFEIGYSQQAASLPPLQVIDFEYQNPEKSFKMQVPFDWNLAQNKDGFAVFLEPKEKAVASEIAPVVADPNIKVAVFRSEMPLYIDDKSLEIYSKEILEKMGGAQAQADNPLLSVFSKNIVDLSNGKKAMLFYVQDKRGQHEIMLAILVTSSGNNIFRVMFTDYKVGFDKNLERYFPVMTSIDVKGDVPVRPNPLKQIAPYAAGVGGFIVLVWFLFFLRKKKYETQWGSDGDSDSDESSNDSRTPNKTSAKFDESRSGLSRSPSSERAGTQASIHSGIAASGSGFSADESGISNEQNQSNPSSAGFSRFK